MTHFQLVQQHPASVDAYIRHGWSLVPIPPGTKGPRIKGWNRLTAALTSQTDLPSGYGIGLAHAYSGTMALDVDHWDRATLELSKRQISLQSLFEAPDAVVINSSNPGHGKLLYKMPFGLVLPSRKMTDADDDGNRYNYLDFRCGTANGLTVQDVLPPSIHPGTGQPYRWAGNGRWEKLPEIPVDLLTVWQDLVHGDRQTMLDAGAEVSISWSEVQRALTFISPDVSREEWVRIGMALHLAGKEIGKENEAFSVWLDWSSQSQTKYKGEKDLIQQWASFSTTRDEKVTLGTLFHLAQDYGWTRPEVDVDGIFSSTTSVTIASPVTLTATLRPMPPDADVDLFPPVLRTRALEVSDAIGCDPLVPLWSGLGAACAVIDARSRLELLPGYEVPPVLWLMTIGDPADKKSPGAIPMLEPLRVIEKEHAPMYAKAVETWEFKSAMWAAAKKEFLRFAESPEAMLGEAAPPSPGPMPDRPVSLRLTISNITGPKLVGMAAERPQGILCYMDEMGGWMRQQNSLKGGEDRANWIGGYEAKSYTVDRVGTGSTICDNLAISMFGNVQPKVLSDNVDGLSEDGMLQRFIPAVLRFNQDRIGKPLPRCMTSADRWENTLRLLFSLPAQTYTLSPEASALFTEFQKWYHKVKADERFLLTSNTFRNALGKIEGTLGRMLLVFHLLENPWSAQVDADLMDRVIKLIKSYIIPSLRYTLTEIADSSSFDAWMIDHIIQHAHEEDILMSDIRAAGRRQIGDLGQFQQNQAILGAMELLEREKWVVRLDDGRKELSGFAKWAINPILVQTFVEYKKQVAEARKRQGRFYLDDM